MSKYPPSGRSSEDPQVISDPSTDFDLPPEASTYTPTPDDKVAIFAGITQLIKRNLDEIRSTSPLSDDTVFQMVSKIMKQFNTSGIRGGFRKSNDPLVVEFKKKFYELVFAVMDKWMTEEPITKDKMDWIAHYVNSMNQSEISEKYKGLMINNATFMEFIRTHRDDLNQLKYNGLFLVLKKLQEPQQPQLVSSVAAAAPVASAKQEAADRLLQLIKGLTIDELMRQQAITDIATLLNMSTNGGSRKRRSIKPKKYRKTKSRKTKSRKTKVYYTMPLTYMQCRDTKCTPERIMNKERAVYMQTLKRKCSLAAIKNNPSNQAIQAHSACATKHYNGSRLKPMDDKQAKCSKKNCDHLIRFGGKKRTMRKNSKRVNKGV